MGRLSLLYCEHCGMSVTPPSHAETLLAKLAQLAGFGLAAEDQPILTSGRPSLREMAFDRES